MLSGRKLIYFTTEAEAELHDPTFSSSSPLLPLSSSSKQRYYDLDDIVKVSVSSVDKTRFYITFRDFKDIQLKSSMSMEWVRCLKEESCLRFPGTYNLIHLFCFSYFKHFQVAFSLKYIYLYI